MRALTSDELMLVYGGAQDKPKDPNPRPGNGGGNSGGGSGDYPSGWENLGQGLGPGGSSPPGPSGNPTPVGPTIDVGGGVTVTPGPYEPTDPGSGGGVKINIPF